MYRKVTVESVPLTPELAAQFARMVPLPGERCLRPTRRAYLAAQLLRRKFSGPDWADGTCKTDGITYRLDGQHSSDLLANLPTGAEFPADLLATITHYEFDSMEDAADVFNLFNNPRSVRNNADMMGVYAARVPGLETFSREFLVDVSNGLYEFEAQRKRRGAKDAVLLGPRDRGLYFLYPNRPEFVTMLEWLAAFRELKNAMFLHRPVIVSEMLAHRMAAPTVADVFWPLVYTETHADPDHETRVLAEAFRELLAVASRPKLDQSVFRRKTQRAWRQFRAGQSLLVPA
jgi:hypothetical protein